MADFNPPNAPRSFCTACGAPVDNPPPRFCSQCGTVINHPAQPEAQPQSANPGQLQQSLGQMAAKIQGGQYAQSAAAAVGQASDVAKKAGAEIGRVLADPTIIEQIPGRSWSLVGAAAVATLVVTGFLSRWISIFRGVGLLWSLVLLVGAAAVAAQELRRAGMPVPGLGQAPEQVQKGLLHPWIPLAFAGVVALQAFQLAEISIVPILWVLVAGLLLYDQWQKSVRSPNGVGRYFDFRLAWTGYRRYILIGAVACLVALFMTWADSPSHFTGGWESHYSSYYEGYVSEYNFTQNFWAGWSLSGRAMSFAMFAELGIIGIVLVSLYRGWQAITSPLRYAPLAVCAMLFVWMWLNSERHLGPFLFLGGDLLMAVAWFFLLKGQNEGEFDLAHLIGRIRK